MFWGEILIFGISIPHMWGVPFFISPVPVTGRPLRLIKLKGIHQKKMRIRRARDAHLFGFDSYDRSITPRLQAGNTGLAKRVSDELFLATEITERSEKKTQKSLWALWLNTR
jgi:hypothetical protein